jgi:menaquinone-dependent protoporphyrinogen oxidase
MDTTNVLVAYGSKHGATAEIAQWIAEALQADGLTAEARPAESVDDIAPYDAVIVGGALYMARWHATARRFVRRHRRQLEHVPVWLFASGPLDHSADDGSVRPAPGFRRLAARVQARGFITFGGQLDTNTPGRMAHSLAEKSGGDYRSREQIAAWAHQIGADLRPSVAR